ncbi:hypothetical protein ACIQW5_21150 [Methylorubrum thiocyanatum]|jgi:hypothetical protein|uniref:hypothetical protein n=1 Tax=Methylorubrum thiocyanatum TaxID=47958 RepID=UPI00383BABEA
MTTEAITHLRNQLAAFVEVQAGDVSTRDLVTSFTAKHADAIQAASAHLTSMALTKLVDDVSRRRLKTQQTGQRDLFHGFSLPRLIVVDIEENGMICRRRRLPRETPCRLIDAYLKRKPKVSRKTRDVGLEDALARALPFATSPDMTLGEALDAAAASEQATAAAV